MREAAIAIAVGLLPLTGLMCSLMGLVMRDNHVDHFVAWPATIFAISSACLIGCVFIRDKGLYAVLMVVPFGIILYLGLAIALSAGT